MELTQPKGKNKNCIRCGAEYYEFPSRMGSKYCSLSCHNNDLKESKPILTCFQCKKQFRRNPSTIKPNDVHFCSQECFSNSNKISEEQRVTPKSEVGRKGKRMRNGVWSTKKADLEFSHYIRDRDKKTCFFCRKVASQNSHFWGRGNSATRYDPMNCDYSCGGCHMRHEGNKQGLYREMKLKQLGKKGYADLERRARSTMKRELAIIECMKLLNAYE